MGVRVRARVHAPKRGRQADGRPESMCMTTRGQSRCRHGSGNACDPTRGDRRPGAPKGGRSGRQPREGKGAAAMGETLAAPPGSPPPPFRTEPSRGDEGGGEGVRRPMNPPWFTCPQAGRGGAAMVHPLTKRPATRGGAALPSKAEGAGCPPPTREGSWGCPTSSLPLSLFVVVGRRCPGRT